jgi:D-3-phosphoglycerate dehydrogenase
VPDGVRSRIAERYEVIDGREQPVLAQPTAVLRAVNGIACTGRALIGEAEIAALSSLSVVSSYSAGLDHIDEAALAHRGIPLHNTSNVLAAAVADLAVGSLLCLLRQLPQADAFVRTGEWTRSSFPFAQNLATRRVGVLGFGRIGRAVAQRLRGFDMEVAYCARQRKPERSEPFFADVDTLADWSDVLVIACSATQATHGLVNARVMAKLGSAGWLVNVARGSIVDEGALILALRDGVIAGAALDVFVDEPHVSAELLALDNVFLTPHIGSATNETRAAMADATLLALDEHFVRAGKMA